MFLLSLPGPPNGGNTNQKARERQRLSGAEERSDEAYTILLGEEKRTPLFLNKSVREFPLSFIIDFKIPILSLLKYPK
jgi:hypothetical protein